jgi:glutathione synthase/RimK-type ligase-like ATP-grasp enzyme
MRQYTFFAGESTITMSAAFTSHKWGHVLRTPDFQINDGVLCNGETSVEGLIYFADSEDKEKALKNLQVLHASAVPCWPLPETLLRVFDRHQCLKILQDAGLVDHQIWQGSYDERREPDVYPCVLKVGLAHRGEGKILVSSRDHWATLERWTDTATLEPFFQGHSVRVLVIGDYVTSFEVINDRSWIKNSAGCDVLDWDASEELVAHARAVAKCLDLEVCGVDYVITNDGLAHLLEANQFPGLTTIPSDDREVVKKFFVDKMTLVEEMAKRKRVV